MCGSNEQSTRCIFTAIGHVRTKSKRADQRDVYEVRIVGTVVFHWLETFEFSMKRISLHSVSRNTECNSYPTRAFITGSTEGILGCQLSTCGVPVSTIFIVKNDDKIANACVHRITKIESAIVRSGTAARL